MSTLGERARSARSVARSSLIGKTGEEEEDDCVMIGHEVSDLRTRLLNGSRQYHTNTGLKEEVLHIDEFVRAMSPPSKPYTNPLFRTKLVFNSELEAFEMCPSFEDLQDSLLRFVRETVRTCNRFPGEHMACERREDREPDVHLAFVKRDSLNFEPLEHPCPEEQNAIALVVQRVSSHDVMRIEMRLRDCIAKSQVVFQNTLLRDIQRRVSLFKKSSMSRVKEFCSKMPSLEEMEQEIVHYTGISKQIVREFEDLEDFSLVRVDMRDAKIQIRERANAVANVILNAIEDRILKQSEHFLSRFRDVKQCLEREPANAKDLVDFVDYTQNAFWDTLTEAKNEFRDPDKGLKRAVMILLRRSHMMRSETQSVFNEAFAWFRRLEKEEYGTCINRLRGKRRALERVCQIQVNKQQTALSRSTDKAENIPSLSGLDPKRVRENFSQVSNLLSGIREQLETSSKIERDENLLNLPPSDFASQLREIECAILPYYHLWKNCAEYRNLESIWTSRSLSQCNSEELGSQLESLGKRMKELHSKLNTTGQDLCETVMFRVRSTHNHTAQATFCHTFYTITLSSYDSEPQKTTHTQHSNVGAKFSRKLI